MHYTSMRLSQGVFSVSKGSSQFHRCNHVQASTGTASEAFLSSYSLYDGMRCNHDFIRVIQAYIVESIAMAPLGCFIKPFRPSSGFHF